MALLVGHNVKQKPTTYSEEPTTFTVDVTKTAVVTETSITRATITRVAESFTLPCFR